MTLHRRFSCCCLSVILACPMFAPVAVCQTTPVEVNYIPGPGAAPAPVKISPELQGDLLVARQRYLDAIAAYREVPVESAVIANKIGVAYHHMFDMADARRYYERAIKLDPKCAEAYNNLGATYHAEKDYRQAERLYRKAIKLEPKNAAFYNNLGTAYFFQKNVKKGTQAYRQAFALDPDVFERGSSNKIEESSTTKEMSEVNYTLAKTYAQAGMNERALAYLRKAIGEGFNDRKKLMTDPELASVRETPEFAQLLNIQRAQ